MQAITHEVAGRTTEQRVYESVEELTRVGVAKTPTVPRGAEAWLNEPDFVGRAFGSWAECEAAVNSCWAEGQRIVDRMLDEVRGETVPQPVCRRRRTRFSETDGAELDYDRLRAGQDFWRTTRRENTAAPANVTLAVDVGANCGVKHEDILWRGVAAIVLTELLEAAGYRVELWAFTANTTLYVDGTDSMLAVCLKRLSDPLDRSTLVNAVSGWVYRTIWFRNKAWSHDGRQSRDYLGYHRIPKRAEVAAITGDAETKVVQAVWSRYEAADFIRRTLKRFTSPIK